METSEMSELNSETYNESRNQLIDSILFVGDEMYPKIKEWTNIVHTEFMKRMDNENSFLEYMTTKI